MVTSHTRIIRHHRVREQLPPFVPNPNLVLASGPTKADRAAARWAFCADLAHALAYAVPAAAFGVVAVFVIAGVL